MREIWRDFPGFEGYYQVSNKSRVRGLKSMRKLKWGRILKPHLTKSKYYSFCFHLNGTKKYLRRSRIVAITWIENDDPKNKIEVNHKNGITTDDDINNLEWITPSNNIKHYYYTLDKGIKRPVIRMDLNGNELERYRTIRMAIRWLKNNGYPKASDGNIVTTCKGHIHYSYGHKWKYAE